MDLFNLDRGRWVRHHVKIVRTELSEVRDEPPGTIAVAAVVPESPAASRASSSHASSSFSSENEPSELSPAVSRPGSVALTTPSRMGPTDAVSGDVMSSSLSGSLSATAAAKAIIPPTSSLSSSSSSFPNFSQSSASSATYFVQVKGLPKFELSRLTTVVERSENSELSTTCGIFQVVEVRCQRRS